MDPESLNLLARPHLLCATELAAGITGIQIGFGKDPCKFDRGTKTDTITAP